MVIKLEKKKTNAKVKKKVNNFNSKNIISAKSLKIYLLIVLICLALLIVRLFQLQLIDGDKLTNLAISQQTSSEIISSKRGNIYDTTGASLAISETVDTISINPSKVKAKKDGRSFSPNIKGQLDFLHYKILHKN